MAATTEGAAAAGGASNDDVSLLSTLLNGLWGVVLGDSSTTMTSEQQQRGRTVSPADACSGIVMHVFASDEVLHPMPLTVYLLLSHRDAVLSAANIDKLRHRITNNWIRRSNMLCLPSSLSSSSSCCCRDGIYIQIFGGAMRRSGVTVNVWTIRNFARCAAGATTDHDVKSADLNELYRLCEATGGKVCPPSSSSS